MSSILARSIQPLLSPSEMRLADIINDFRYNTKPTDMSPPNMNQEQLAIRNLAVIDLANKIAQELGCHTEAFLHISLSKRT